MPASLRCTELHGRRRLLLLLLHLLHLLLHLLHLLHLLLQQLLQLLLGRSLQQQRVLLNLWLLLLLLQWHRVWSPLRLLLLRCLVGLERLGRERLQLRRWLLWWRV